ncbi:cytokine receptor family member b2 [Paramisgurnus dabryanus]|uniref:cytokine receptor family member b2 n=1 Tax=Paramisgurnus dabryanus TaxID=90735 RepID=UPI0031F3916F
MCLVTVNYRTMCGMIEILISISLLHTALSSDITLPAPVNLTISSHHFVHLLSWSKGPGSPDGVHYAVSMRRLSNTSKILVKGCEKVTSPLQCNLTEVFSDLEDTYYINVSAVMGNHPSSPAGCSVFIPYKNTTLEPPLVSLTNCAALSLCVNLQAPSPHLHSIYNSIKYRLKISIENGSEFSKDREGLKNVTLNNLTPGQRYCVTVSIIDYKYSSKPAVCESIPTRGNISVSDVLIAVVVCLLMVPLVIWVLPRLLIHFFYQKVNLPAVLSSFQCQHQINILLIRAESISELTEDTDILQKMKQNREEHEESDEETEEESVTYETIATQHLKAQDAKSSGSGSLVNQSSGSHPWLCSSIDAPLSPSCSVNEEDIAALTSSHHLPHERKPLLKSVFEERAENEADDDDDEDINLCSVMLGGVLLEQTHSNTAELELVINPSHAKPLETAASRSSLSAPCNSLEIHICDSEEEDEYSGYLSRT